MMNSMQVIELSKLLVALRPDWDLSGTHLAVGDLAKRDDPPFTLCRLAIDRASIAANRTPNSLVWAEQYPATVLEQDRPRCGTHGGEIRHADGNFSCCKFGWPDEPPAKQPRDVPPIVRELFPAGGTA